MRVAVAVGSLQVLGSDEGLDEEPVDGLVWRVIQRERREVDLRVPGFQEVVIGA